MEIRVVPDVMIPCSLLNKEIPQALCYEINIVLDEKVVPSFVPEVKDWMKALDICPHCKVSYYRDVREYRGEVI